MQEEGMLIGIAQIGMGFAGFGGLIAMFKRREEEWGALDVAGIQLILYHTLALVLTAVAPTVFFRIFGSRNISFGLTSAFLGIFLVSEFLRNFSLLEKLEKVGIKPHRPKRLKYDFLLGSLVMSVLQFLNCLYFFSFELYVIALFWLLYTSAVQFYFTLTRNLPKMP
jgi:hypothetical protein